MDAGPHDGSSNPAAEQVGAEQVHHHAGHHRKVRKSLGSLVYMGVVGFLGHMGTQRGAAHIGAEILHSTASCQESAEILRSVFDEGAEVYLLDEEFLSDAIVVQRDSFVGVSSMLRAGAPEQYFATRDGMYYLITIGAQGPSAWWCRRTRSWSRSSTEFQGYAADVKFAGEHLNGFVLRSGLYEDLGGDELKVASAVVQ